LPISVWGKVKRNFKGWDVSTKIDVESEDLKATKYQIDAANKDIDTSFKMMLGSTEGIQN